MDLLVAVDGSDESDRALRYAMTVAEATDGTIAVVHAIEPDVYDAGGGEPNSFADREDRLIIEGLDDAERQGRTIVDEAVEAAATAGHEASGELRYGHPATTIVEYAEEGGFDTIYVGNRGRSERVAGLLGSVARDVIERATVPVTVVR